MIGKGGRSMSVAAAVALVACSSAPSPAARANADEAGSAPDEASQSATTVKAPEPAPSVPEADVGVAAPEPAIPAACAEGPLCVPPSAFAQRLCDGLYPEAALHMFAPKTPWKRAYVKRAFQAWHVGGHGDMRELRANEEVLIVMRGRGGSGPQVVGGEPFDVLRWDGTCVSLMEDELSFHKPSEPVPANIAWQKLGPRFQALFAAQKSIEQHRDQQVRLCETKAAGKEPGKSKCELARRSLSLAIARTVWKGAALPEPSSIP